MVFITVPFTDRHSKMTLDDLLFNAEWHPAHTFAPTSTVTYAHEADEVGQKLRDKFPVALTVLIQQLSEFNARFGRLYHDNMSSEYNTFYIPKKSGGLRRIDAPNYELTTALRYLKGIFDSAGTLYHTNAYAYIKHRSTIDAVKRHQQNESKWFAKFDLHDFFGSTTPDFVINTFSMVYPFSEVLRDPIGSEEFRKAISLAFLNGGLPQGTPVSPTITNIMMIPFDYAFTKYCRSKSLVYTRYADDFIVSSRARFDFRTVESEICRILSAIKAPFSLNKSKTRFGSSSGSNWNLGVVLNKDNNITIGHRNKRRFETMLFNYAMDRKNGKSWQLDDVRTLSGLWSYYSMVERDAISRIVKHMSDKTGVNIPAAIHEDLNPQPTIFF